MSNGTGRRFQRRQWVWIMLMVDIVFFMLLMTLGIIALQVGNNGSVGNKDISISVDDEHGTSWSANTPVDIFSASYVNDRGEVTIASADGSKVCAPGFNSSYSFTLHNKADGAVSYETNVSFLFTLGGIEDDRFETLPILVRLFTSDNNGNVSYLVGDSETWKPLSDDLCGNYQLGVLGVESYQKFTLELWWPMEGNDDLDTLLGNLATESNGSAVVTMQISTYAERHSNSLAEGGIKEDGSQTNGNLVSWLWVIFLLINGSVLIFYVAWLLNKRSIEAYEKSEKENTESGTAT